MENAELVRDWRGRSYLVGPVPSDRARMFRLAWASMVAIGPLQYGYAALLVRDGLALIPLAAWIVCQAATPIPVLHLVRRGRLGVRAALAAGAALSGLGLVTLALTTATPALLTGYALLGGMGAGLVYGVCGEVVTSWHPERPAVRLGLITGAFGYGAAPLLVLAGAFWDATPPPGGALTWVFLVAGVAAVAVIGAAALFLRVAPPRWWPADVDPRAHALDPALLRRTPPAIREFSPSEAVRTPALAGLAAVLVCAGAVSLFDVVAVAATGSWAAVAVLVALNGAGRALAMRCSELWGRRRVLTTVLALLTLGQLLLAASTAAATGTSATGTSATGTAATGTAAGIGGMPADPAASAVLLWLGVLAAGAGGGAFYPLVAGLVRDFFGIGHVGPIGAVVYSTKAVAGLLGTALAALALTGSPGVFLLAAALTALPAIAAPRLRHPGLPAAVRV
ncbi:hypothetical protein HII36_19860 [Nonomuraea sp. NN258]|uniref:hypothetical protein n=1 Tax=Nonomuraea antri TaxID=2730852 RepID=UPI0015696B7B|nr:hypothetical protein [Nonomuraea antri]NRQ34091.1 hypothetical protein [Nonomuraea antri]